MNLDGARVYIDGVGIGDDCEEKIRKVVSEIKLLFTSSDISMKFLKNGKTYEGLLWGEADGKPIGVYRRGPSMAFVVDTMYQRVKRDGLKILEMDQRNARPNKVNQAYSQQEMAA